MQQPVARFITPGVHTGPQKTCLCSQAVGTGPRPEEDRAQDTIRVQSMARAGLRLNAIAQKLPRPLVTKEALLGLEHSLAQTVLLRSSCIDTPGGTHTGGASRDPNIQSCKTSETSVPQSQNSCPKTPTPEI